MKTLPRTIPAFAVLGMLLAPAILAGFAAEPVAAQGTTQEAHISFDRERGYTLGITGDLMRLEGAATVLRDPATRWELRILDPEGVERGSSVFVGASFSGHVEVQLQPGDLHGTWRGEARRLDPSATAWVLAAAVVTGVGTSPAPGRPTVTATTQDNSIDIRWSSEVNPPAYYELEVATDPSFGTLVHELHDASDTRAVLTGRFTTTYHIRVRVRDAYNDYGPWAETTATTAPAMGTVAFEHAAYYVGPAGGDRVQARVRALGDAEAEWRLQIKDPYGVPRLERNATGISVDLAASIVLAGSDPRGDWQAEVSSRYAGGPWTPWQSAVATVQSSPVPLAPALSLAPHGRDIDAVWLPSGGLGDLKFDVQVATDPTFATGIVTSLTNTSSESLAFTGNWGATYYVRARARDGYGTESSWGVASVSAEPEPLPDLVIAARDVWIHPDEPVRAEAALIRANVQNRGTLAASNVNVGLYVKGVLVSSTPVTLSPTQSTVVTFPHAFSAEGAADIRLVADPGNAVRESKEDNNEQSLSVTVQAPRVDLEVSAANITLSPASPTPGQLAQVRVKVTNLGGSPSGVVPVRVLLNGTLLAEPTVSLTGGASATVDAAWTPAAGGAYTITAFVDPNNVVNELRETNNKVEKTVSITAIPDLVIDALQLPTSASFVGDIATVRVNVRNGGSLASPASTVELRAALSGQPLAAFTTLTVPALAPGATTTVTGTWTATVAGTYSFEALLDPKDSVTELSEANNRLTGTHVMTDKPLPDLRVSFGADTDSASYGIGKRLQVTVTNVGNYYATGVNVKVLLRDVTTSDVTTVDIGSETLEILLVGESRTYSFPWAADYLPAPNPRLELRAEATLAESDRTPSDNAAAKDFRLLWADVSFGTEKLWVVNSASDVASHRMWVTNNGTAPLDNVRLTYSRGAGGKSHVSTFPGLAPGESRAIPLTALSGAAPGIYPAPLRVEGVTSAQVTEPAELRADNAIQIIFVVPGERVFIEPARGIFSDAVLPMSVLRTTPGSGQFQVVPDINGDPRAWRAAAHGRLVIETYGRDAANLHAATPTAKLWWDEGVREMDLTVLAELAENGGYTHSALGDATDPNLAALTARRVWRVVLPSVAEMRENFCPRFEEENWVGNCDTASGAYMGAWNRKLAPQEIAGVNEGYEYDIHVSFTGTVEGKQRVAKHDVPLNILYDGHILRTFARQAIVHAEAGAAVASSEDFKVDVDYREDGLDPRCGFHVSICPAARVPLTVQKYVEATSTWLPLDEASAEWRGDNAWADPIPSVSIKLPGDFRDYPLLVRLVTDNGATSAPFTLIRSDPSFRPESGYGATGQPMYRDTSAMYRNGLYVLSLDVEPVGFGHDEIRQAFVRLCYDGSAVDVIGDTGGAQWWDAEGYAASSKLSARNLQCPSGTGPAAAFRSMPLAGDKGARFSFIVKPKSTTDKTVTFVANLFNKEGEPVTYRNEARQSVQVRGAAASAAATPQFLRELDDRLGKTEDAALDAIDSNHDAWVDVGVKLGEAKIDSALSGVYDGAKTAVLIAKGGKGIIAKKGIKTIIKELRITHKIAGVVTASLENLDDGISEAVAEAAVDKGFVDGLLDITGVNLYHQNQRANIANIASAYRHRISDSAGSVQSGLTPERARELIYKLDVAQNIFNATLIKTGSPAPWNTHCVLPEKAPPQPGHPASQSGPENYVLCGNREMHPIDPQEITIEDGTIKTFLHYPNLVGRFHSTYMVVLESDEIDRPSQIANGIYIAATLTSLAVPATAPVAGPVAFGASIVGDAYDSVIETAKEATWRVASVAYPVSQRSVRDILEHATADPNWNTEYYTGTAYAGRSASFALPPTSGTTAYTVVLSVEEGAPLPELRATTPAGFPVVATTETSEGVTTLTALVPVDAPREGIVDVVSASTAEPVPYVLAVSQTLAPDVRFVRLNVTSAGEPVPGLDLRVSVNGAETPVTHILGGLPEFRARQGEAVTVVASAQGYVTLNRTVPVSFPGTYGTFDLNMTPLVRAPLLAVATLPASSQVTVSLRLENPLNGSTVVNATLAGLPADVNASVSAVTVPALGSATLPILLKATNVTVPGGADARIELRDAAGQLVRSVPLALTVKGPRPVLVGAPAEVYGIGGLTTRTSLTLRNAGNDLLTGVALTLSGVPWVSFEGVPSQLAPGAEANVTLVATPPLGVGLGVTNATLLLSGAGGLSANRSVAVHAFGRVTEVPSLAVPGGDIDGDGDVDQLVAERRGQGIFLGARDGLGHEVGLEARRVSLVTGGITWIDTGLQSATHALGDGEMLSIWSTDSATLARVVRGSGAGFEVRYVATAPGPDAPRVETRYATSGDLREGVIAGAWGTGVRGPGLALGIGEASLSAAIFSHPAHSPVAWRLEPVAPGSAAQARGSSDAVLSGIVTAVFGDAFVLQDASGGVLVTTQSAPPVRVGDVGIAKVGSGSDGRLALRSFRITGSAAAPVPAVNATGLAAVVSANGTVTVDVSGTVASVNGTGATLTTPAGPVTVRFDASAPAPAITVGNTVTFRGAAQPGGLLLAVPPVVKITPSGTVKSGWFTTVANVVVAASNALQTERRVDGGALTTYTGPFNVTTDGIHLVEAFAKDGRLNVAPGALEVRVDRTAPTTNLTYQGPTWGTSPRFVGPTTSAVLAASDAASGVNKTTLCVRSACATYSTPVPFTGPDGTAAITYWSEDKVGWKETNRTASVTFDGTAPVTSANLSGTAGTAPWYRSAVTVTLSCSDGSGSGCALTEHQRNALGWQPYTAPFTLSGDAVHTLSYRSADRVGNVESNTHVTNVSIDTTPPSVNHSLAGTQGGASWYRSAVTVTLTGSDAMSGLLRLEYQLNNGTVTTYASPVTVSTNSSGHSFRYRGVDVAGNVGPWVNLTLKIDRAKAVTLMATTPTAPGPTGWFTSTPSVTLTCADQANLSGCSKTEYRFNATASWSTYATPLGMAEGNTTVEARSVDVAGNVQSPVNSSTYRVDTVAPSTAVNVSGERLDGVSWFKGPATVTADVTETTSGLNHTEWMLNEAGPTRYMAPFLIEGSGKHRLQVRSVDVAGNAEAWPAARDVWIDRLAPTTGLVPNGDAVMRDGWLKRPLALTLACTDQEGLSGCYETWYTLDGGAPKRYPPSVGITTDGEHTLVRWSEDVAGNVEEAVTEVLRVDSLPPFTSPDFDGPTVDRGNNVVGVGASTVVTLSANDDGSGVNATFYTVETGGVVNGPHRYVDGITFTGTSGHRTVRYWSDDVAGNVEAERKLEIEYDVDAPVVNITRPAKASVTVDRVIVGINPATIIVGSIVDTNVNPIAIPTWDGAVVVRSVNITVSATDPSGVARVAFRATHVPTGQVRYPCADDTTGPDFTCYWSVLTEERGDWVINATGFDRLGNTGWATRNVTVVSLPASTLAPGSAPMTSNMVTLINGMNACVPEKWESQSNLVHQSIVSCIKQVINGLSPSPREAEAFDPAGAAPPEPWWTRALAVFRGRSDT